MGPQPNSCGNEDRWKKPRLQLLASMGPQPNSCGNEFIHGANLAVEFGFNGATAKQLWKHTAKELARRFPIKLQWGHSQTAVETTPRPYTTPRPGTSFNGATAKQLWKLRELEHLDTSVDVASMGPQPNSCGNEREDRSPPH